MRRLPVLITTLALALAGCGDDAKDNRDSAGGAPAGSPQSTRPAEANRTPAGCEQAKKPPPKPDGGEKKPAKPLAEGKTYSLVVATNCGEFTMTLDQKQSPKAAASLVSLAEKKFFDGTTFHRIAPGFVIQGGDPTGTGTGGPGYSTRDKPPADAAYTKGVVAMAKTEQEPPGTAGSQFYVVTGDDAGLPPDYAIVGKVTKGQEVVDRIGEQGDASEKPVQPIVIETVRVEEG